MRNCKCLILIIGLILLAALPAFALDWADYYPAGQGSSWTYREYGSEGGVSYDKTNTFFINGFEDVDYSGTIYSGYKLFDDPVYYTVERVSDAGLENIKWGGSGSYELTGSAIGTSPDQPWIIVPRIFNIGDTLESPYKEYFYNSSGVLQKTNDHNFSLTFQALEDVTVPAGTFADCLKVFFEESWGNGGNITGSGNGTRYFAPGVGLVKDYGHDINNYGTEYIVNRELTGYTVTPEPISCALFLLGAGALAAVRKKRNRS